MKKSDPESNGMYTSHHYIPIEAKASGEGK